MNTTKSSSKKTIIIGVIVIAVTFLAWYFYQKGRSPAVGTSGLVATPGAIAGVDQSAVGAGVLSVLNSVSSIHIDSSFFSSPAYQSLVDYSIAVPSAPVGRPNPFAPTGSSAAAPGDTSGTANQ
jgi:hypothetical protein